jgi:hypothetical protein
LGFKNISFNALGSVYVWLTDYPGRSDILVVECHNNAIRIHPCSSAEESHVEFTYSALSLNPRKSICKKARMLVIEIYNGNEKCWFLHLKFPETLATE